MIKEDSLMCWLYHGIIENDIEIYLAYVVRGRTTERAGTRGEAATRCRPQDWREGLASP